jgi:hypothetical protein
MAPAPTAAELARRSHSTRSALVAAVTDWYPITAPIAAWTVHLVLLTSVVRLSCEQPGFLWLMHATTGVTLAVTAVAMALSWRLARTHADAEAGTVAAHTRFLGQLGLLVGAVNALLIVVEELLVVAFGSQRCG